MGMHENIRDIVKLFRFDETLLRLLYYSPKDKAKNIKDPLDSSLANILDIDKDWKIRDKRIMTIPRSDDSETDPICRIYFYAGRRIPQNNNFLVANQQVIVDILCHSDFEKDLRSMRISDRINELLVLGRSTGMGKVDYVDGGGITSPNSYVGYRHIYQFASAKK